MISSFISRITAIIFAFLFLLYVPANGPSAQTISDPEPLLITFSDGARTLEGDHDHRQLVRFSVPLTVSGPLHVRVFDADTGGSYDEMLGRSDTVMDYTLYGGGSTASISRDGDGVLVESVEGKKLGVVEIGRDNKFDGKWSTLFTVDAGDGKIMGDAREFFLLVEGMGGNDGNVFDVRISTNEDANISPQGVKLYSFLPTVRVTKRGHVTELGFEAPESTSSLKIDNFDSARGAIIFAGRFRSLPLKASGQDEWQSGTIVLEDNEKGGLVSITLGGGQELPNDVTFFVADDQDQPVAITLPPKSFRSNKRPVIKVSQTPQSCTAMRFDAGGSSDPDGKDLTYRWVFHDGAVMSGASVIRHYRKAGQYAARLEVFDGSGQIGNGTAEELEVFIKAPPVARLKVPQIVAQGGEFEINAGGSFAPKLGDGGATTLVRYEWDMGNGVKFEGTKPTLKHSYGDYGSHTIKLKVTDSSNHPCNSVTTLATIEINAAPIPNAGGDRKIGHGDFIQFSAAKSTDPDGDELTYKWDLGDGSMVDSSDFGHLFNNAGVYFVTLSVDDGRQAPNSTQSSKIMVLVNAPPKAVIKSPLSMIVGQPGEISAEDSSDPDGEISKIEWTLPDGRKINRKSFPYAFFTAGDHKILLSVIDDSGLANGTTTISRTISVVTPTNLAPVAKSGGDREITVGDIVKFSGSKSTDIDGSILSYEWDFGDGHKASGLAADHVFRNVGTFEGKLTVTDDSGMENATAMHDFTTIVKQRANVPPALRAGGDRSAYVNEVVLFDSNGTTDHDGTAISYYWDFGDGEKASGTSAKHSYKSPGTYKVYLIVADDSGRSNRESETSFQVAVTHKPNAIPVFDIPDQIEGVIGQVLTFDGRGTKDPDGYITSYEWSFGDGINSNLALVKHAYAKAGTYFVRFTVIDDSGLPSGRLEKQVSVLIKPALNIAPVAKAKAKSQAIVGELIEFHGSSSTDEDGSIIRYDWDFGNGKTVSGEKVKVSYFEPGTYTVRLTVTDNSGQENARTSDQFDIVIENQSNTSPIAKVGPDRPAAIDESVAFSGLQSRDGDGNIISYEWDFGDGAAASGRDASHTYKKSGRYVAKLIIRDDSGLTNNAASSERIIIVNEPPRAAAGKDQYVTASVVQFNAADSVDQDGSIIAYRWRFGDGQSGEGRSISHTYREPGTYEVSLEVEDDSGAIRNVDQDELSIIVNALPVADAGFDVTAAPGESINFDGRRSLDPDGTIAKYEWDFKDGSRDLGDQVAHAFSKPGTYYVSLKVTDNSMHENAIDFSNVRVVVNSKPNALAGRNIVVAPGEQFTLSGADSFDKDGEISEWQWDFSDGSSAKNTREASHSFEKPGVYRAILTVSDGSIAANNTDQDSLEIFVNHSPAANAGKDVFRDKLRIVLDGSSSSDADSDGLTYRWDLGDGNTAFGPKVAHVYATGGAYPVVLTVDDGRGLNNSTNRDSMKVEINRPPVAVAGGDKHVCVGDFVVFDGSSSIDPDKGPIRYFWDFGDGGSSKTINPTKSFEKPGTYQVQLQVEDDSNLKNNTHRDTLLVSVDPAPVADAGEDILACANSEVRFDGSKSTDIDGVVNRFSWKFGDATSGGGDRPKHSYTSAGTYRASLTIVGDSRGLCSPTSHDEVMVKIVNAPRGVISAENAVAVGTDMKFDATASYADGGEISEYTWNFGDGQSGEGINISHRFEKAGIYNVGLTVKSPDLAVQCQSNTSWHVVTVNAAPMANAGGDRAATVNRMVELSGTQSTDEDGGITAYHWNFGDGSLANGLDVRHAWREPGQYTVKLTVTDDTDLPNNSNTTQFTVIVDRAPEASIVTAQTLCAGDAAEFRLSGLGDDIDKDALRWSFGDGSTAIGSNVRHKFEKYGTYSVSVGGGVLGQQTSTQTYISRNVKVNRPPVANPGSFRKTCPGTAVNFDASKSFDFDGKLSTFEWKFGDGHTLKGRQVSHKFSKPGTYSVSLTVTDNSGSTCASTTKSVDVFVNSPPVADGGPDIKAWTGGARDRVSFDATRSYDVDGDALDYYWELSSGEEFEGDKPGHSFSRPGKFTLELTAADVHDLPCSISTDTIEIDVKSRQTAAK